MKVSVNFEYCFPQICEDGVLVIIWLRKETKKKEKNPLYFCLEPIE
jgi:hypothetical protein